MTTLTAPDITTTSALIGRRNPTFDCGLEYFSRRRQSSDNGDRWTRWLREISASPASFEDDLVTAPSSQAILLAIDFLSHMSRIDAPPDIVTLGPNGQIVFERRAGDNAEQIVIYDDLRADWIAYHNGRLIDRQVIIEPEPPYVW